MRLAVSALLLGLASPLATHSSAMATSTGRPHSRSSVTVTVPFGKPARSNNQVFRPAAIIESSRCPTLVYCLWRGRLTLVSGTPRSLRGETFAPRQYHFQLRVELP